MDVGDAVGAVVGRREPDRAALLGPAVAGGGADAERSELVERERSDGEALQDVLDAVEFGVALGVGGFLPGLGAVEGDASLGEQAAQGLAAQADHSAVNAAQVGGEFADRPAGEGLAWAVTLYMGLQSLGYYAILSWLPTLL